MLPQAVGAGHQVEDVRRALEVEKPERLFARDLSAVQNAPRQVVDFAVDTCVNQVFDHG